MEMVPRHTFVPHHYQDLAARELALPIGCGQTLDEPWLIARMIEALAIRKDHRVLQIGAGSGYATALLAHLAGEVIGLERYQSLASAAQTRLADLGLTNAAVVWADGLELPSLEPFDRILVHAVLHDGTETLTDRLVADGILAVARPFDDAQKIVRMTKRDNAIETTAICACHLLPLVPGLATAL